MLELIVLGQIPGTDVQITFAQIASFMAAFFICYLGSREIEARLQQHRNMRSEAEEKAL